MSCTSSSAASGPLKHANLSSTCCLKCSQPYRDPRMLSCCHSFCTQCIQSLINEDTGINTLTCPSCHQITPVPQGLATSLPRNLRLINKQSLIFSKITSNPPPLCDSCNEDTSVAYCTECSDLLCKQCWNAHKKLRLSRTHSSFTLDEGHTMSRDKLSKVIPSFTHTCQDHSDQQLKYYCQQCIIPVCSECTIIKHKDHPVTEVSKQVDINKATVHESIQGFQEAQQQLKKVLISGEEIKEKINARKNEIDTIIRQTFSTLQQLLHQREEALLAQSSEVANAKVACLSLQLDGVQHLLEAMTYCESLVTSAVGEYNDVELVSVAHTLQTRANQLQQEFSETSLEICESPTISVDINTDELATKIANVDITFKEFLLTTKSQSIQDSPFNFSIIGLQEYLYTKFKNPVQTITGINYPRYIAFSDHGDMFVTSHGDHCIYVYDSNGRQKTTIGSKGTGPLQFNCPTGIAINKDIMYVADKEGHKIDTFTLGGEFLGTIGNKGSDNGQFSYPWGICIGPDDKLYVADTSNNRIKVFHRDGSFARVINCKVSGSIFPAGVTFDSSGDLHVTCAGCNVVIVFTIDGQYVRLYGQSCLSRPRGIAIDSSGNSYVANSSGNSLSIFDPHGNYIHSIGGFNYPVGVAITSNGSVWVADWGNNRLLKY